MILLHVRYCSSSAANKKRRGSSHSQALSQEAGSMEDDASLLLTESDVVKLYKTQGYNVKVDGLHSSLNHYTLTYVIN
jgi:hypothetical protein